MVPLVNDPIMSGGSIWLIRHLEHRNPSIMSDSIGRASMVQQFRNGTEERHGGMERIGMVYSCLRGCDVTVTSIVSRQNWKT